MTDAVDVRIPITLLTGFLGSGKTTVLNNLLKPSFWERLLRAPPLTAVIMNEFGSIGLDHQLVDNTQGTMALLSGGCVCCEIQGSLVPTLKNLWMGRRDGKIPPYERIIIETTGIADPTPILETLLRSDWVAKRHYLDGVVTTVDAVFGNGQLDQHFEAVRQVAGADRLLLTKTDLADTATIQTLESRLASINPSAPIVHVQHGNVDPDHVFKLRAYHQSEPVKAKQWLAAENFRVVSASLPLKQPSILNPSTPTYGGTDGRIRSFFPAIRPTLALGRGLRSTRHAGGILQRTPVTHESNCQHTRIPRSPHRATRGATPVLPLGGTPHMAGR
jgi:Putative GTPases (G3E family)